MTYKQLSLDERYQIQTLLKQRHLPADIARCLGRHPSTIARELKRNRYPSSVEPYKATYGQSQARERRQEKAAGQRKIQGELKDRIERKLRLSWSPEQISGRLLAEEGVSISHETIYQHILRDSRNLGFYRYCLRFGGYKHHRFKKSKTAERTRARKNWIEERPVAANKRSEIGHWERDCLLGKRGDSALLTMVDRRSRYLRVIHVPKLNTDTVAAATAKGLHGLKHKTITNDNGIEFQRDESLQTMLGIPIYFCNPHSPWERGSVENANGLIRQYFPKSSDFDAMPTWGPAAVENTLNFRPTGSRGSRVERCVHRLQGLIPDERWGALLSAHAHRRVLEILDSLRVTSRSDGKNRSVGSSIRRSSSSVCRLRSGRTVDHRSPRRDPRD